MRLSFFNLRPKKSGTPLLSSIGKEVGEVTDGCLKKHVRYSRHLFKKLDGWTWDKAIVERAVSLGAEFILIIDDEKHVEYRVSMRDFLQFATPIHYPGYDEQLCLPRVYWVVTQIPKSAKKKG